MGRDPTPSNRVAISKALTRLRERGLIEWGRSQRGAGNSYLYRWPQKHGGVMRFIVIVDVAGAVRCTGRAAAADLP